VSDPPKIRLTAPTHMVLETLDAARDPLPDHRICQETGLAADAVAAILERLENAGWVEATRGIGRPSGRTRRGFYILTDAGRAAVRGPGGPLPPPGTSMGGGQARVRVWKLPPVDPA
jgi:DNA-binding MarR family transcriptional regulator